MTAAVDLDEVGRVAARVRSFLEPLWADADPRSGEFPDARGRPASEGMCLPSSLVLAAALSEATGDDWEVRGGSPWTGTGSCGGFLHGGRRWEAHFWVRSGDVVVDVTADQFGCEAVLVTHAGDGRYGDNRADDDLAACVASVGGVADEWLLGWEGVAGTSPRP